MERVGIDKCPSCMNNGQCDLRICYVIENGCSLYLEREGSPRTPLQEKEELVGAASLEADVLVDNIVRATERRILAGAREPNLLVMNGETYKSYIEGLSSREDGAGWAATFDVQFMSEMKPGEFVLRHTDKKAEKEE